MSGHLSKRIDNKYVHKTVCNIGFGVIGAGRYNERTTWGFLAEESQNIGTAESPER